MLSYVSFSVPYLLWYLKEASISEGDTVKLPLVVSPLVMLTAKLLMMTVPESIFLLDAVGQTYSIMTQTIWLIHVINLGGLVLSLNSIKTTMIHVARIWQEPNHLFLESETFHVYSPYSFPTCVWIHSILYSCTEPWGVTPTQVIACLSLIFFHNDAPHYSKRYLR